jgi:exopolysaccharide production protein ExoQ
MGGSLAKFDYSSGTPLDRNIEIILICVGIWVLQKRRMRFSVDFGKNIWLYSFYFYALVSVSWSDYMGVSIKRWIKLAGDVVMVLMVLTEDDPVEAIDHIFRRCAILLIPLSVFFIRYNRSIGVYYDRTGNTTFWRGVSDNKNTLGMTCAFIGVFLIWRLFKRWPKINYLDLFLLLLTLYLLFGSHSSTSAIAFFVGTIILFLEFLLKGDKENVKRIMISALLFIGILIGFFGESVTTLFFSSAGRDATFTGRTALWEDMIKIGSQRPILGHGYGGFWLGELTTHYLWNTYYTKPNSSHNGYIDVFIDLGLVGLMLLFFLLIHTYKHLIHIYQKTKIESLQLAFFIMILLHNITESSFARVTNFLWLIFLSLAIHVDSHEMNP